LKASGIASLLAADHRADLRDMHAMTAALENRQPDVVLHLAARTVVRESFVIPVETISANAMGHGQPAGDRAPAGETVRCRSCLE